MLEKMLKDHEALRQCAAELRALVAGDRPCPMEALAECRWNLGRTMMQHLAYEDRHLYIQLENDPRPGIAEIGKAFQVELASSFGNYVEHAKSWTPERIQCEWPVYCGNVRAFLDLLVHRIEREERELYPLVGHEIASIDTAAPAQRNWARDAWTVRDNIHDGLDKNKDAA